MNTHPLEPLSAAEVQTAVSLLKTMPSFGPATRIISIMLKEPAKHSVHAWPSGTATDRRASAVLLDNASNSVAAVDLNLTENTVVGVRPAPAGAQPTLSFDEQIECEQAVLSSPVFRAALEKQYGITDTSLVMVDIWSAGYYGQEEERTRRLTRPLCFLRSDPTDNGYARPIEGIRPVVDLNTMQVIRVEEYGHWPLPPESGNYAATRFKDFRTDIKPLAITQPEGPAFSLAGNSIAWQNWKFVIGFNAREGLTIHNVRYHDRGRDRSILYRGSLTEMVVPYGDPSPTQVRKNAFDVGEYGMGMCANSLRLGCDCLGHIDYLDAHLCDSRGRAFTIPNAICIHEEDYGILWKHTDRRLPEAPEVRRSRRLVVSSISTVENYEYGFFWYFYQDGNIQFEIKLTGILSLGTVRPDEKPKHGSLIAPLLYAPNHQHFFNVRLDFDLDGVENTVQQLDVVADPIDPSNQFENAFRVRATNLETEQQALAKLNLESARTWKIVNPNSRNAVGEAVGYKFVPGDNSFPFASPNAWWRKRAGFVNHHVWVTPFSEEENYAAGDYPNQSQGGDGLTKWTAADRPIANRDVVFWYTFGHTHIPRPEDYPVMPTAYIGFLLKPNGFFDANPANDVPPTSRCKLPAAETAASTVKRGAKEFHPVPQFDVLADYGDQCGECPIWDRVGQDLYWTDITGRRFFRWSLSRRDSEIVAEGFEIAGFALRERGGFAVTNSQGFWLWDGTGKPELIAESVDGKLCALNDCTADPAGRLFSGSCFYNSSREDYTSGYLFRVDLDGSAHIVAEGLRLSNGLGFSPEETTLYLTDSAVRTIFAFDYRRSDGTIRNKRVFVKVPSEEGVPDGLTVDAGGFVWSVQWFGGCLVRYDPDGIEERRIEIPASQTTSMTFGGPDLTDMFVTSASVPDALPLAPPGYRSGEVYTGGKLFHLNLDLQGKDEYRARIGR